MGLGKTMQCCAFLAGMLGSGLAARALVVAPKTLLAHWKQELATCGLSRLTHEYYGTSQCDRCGHHASLQHAMEVCAGMLPRRLLVRVLKSQGWPAPGTMRCGRCCAAGESCSPPMASALACL